MPVLGLAGCHGRKWKLAQVRRLASQSVSPDQMGVFVGSGPKWSAATPCITSERPKRSFTSLQMRHTHTPGRSRVNPERQEEEKSGLKRRANDQNSAGGRGTDGPPEPTYTAKRTCTHLNPTIHYGEARGELGTRWGTSWWQTRKTKTYTEKRTWPKQRTHLNPTTHYGEAAKGGNIGTNGGLVGDERKPKQWV